jgi:hypothetical protein
VIRVSEFRMFRILGYSGIRVFRVQGFLKVEVLQICGCPFDNKERKEI